MKPHWQKVMLGFLGAPLFILLLIPFALTIFLGLLYQKMMSNEPLTI